MSELRQLGNSDLHVSAVALGCWPIAGMTSLNVNEADSLATIAACLDHGVNFLDTAFCYGADGESERLIARAIGNQRDQFVIATKGGIHWGPDGKQAYDASPATLRRECETSLRRLNTDRVELYYLHAPDPSTPIAETAGVMKSLMDEGKTRTIGVSNLNVQQMEEFARECPITVCQPHYNLLQREIEADILPWCRERGVALAVYWPIMKGFLAGKLPRDHVFDPKDGRKKYPMFQGEEWTKNQDFLDALRPIAAQAGVTLAQLAILWTISQPGVTVALCGAKRPAQLAENAGTLRARLTAEQWQRVANALEQRGQPVSRAAV
ncbi:MAG: aldo/keto reductase [Planctomycetia bacterium]|nr:aldo/keto reductase [Planctomycetia bacterium]